MKKFKRIFCNIATAIILSALIFTQNSFAVDKINPDDYNPSKYNSTSDTSVIIKFIQKPGDALLTFGIIISIIALMIMGVKYILGSVNEKAEYKKHLGPIVLGMIVITLILSIVKVLATLGNTINSI